jgi:ectoine hydroxylase-related dioxygenase (phytanoyl-CoA dioxygenase family)
MSRPKVDQHGFELIPGVLHEQEIKGIVEPLRDAEMRRSRAGIRHLMSSPEIGGLAKDPRLRTIAEEILGCEAIPFRATLFDKSPTANWLVAWHQDTALPIRERTDIPGWGPWSVKEGINYGHAPTHALDQVVALRVHLDNSTKENGPLRVLPGTHKLGVLTDEEVYRLGAESSSCNCLADQGTVLAMRPLLIHSSSKCQSQASRRVLHIEYASSMRIADGMELAVA